MSLPYLMQCIIPLLQLAAGNIFDRGFLRLRKNEIRNPQNHSKVVRADYAPILHVVEAGTPVSSSRGYEQFSCAIKSEPDGQAKKVVAPWNGKSANEKTQEYQQTNLDKPNRSSQNKHSRYNTARIISGRINCRHNRHQQNYDECP